MRSVVAFRDGSQSLREMTWETTSGSPSRSCRDGGRSPHRTGGARSGSDRARRHPIRARTERHSSIVVSGRESGVLNMNPAATIFRPDYNRLGGAISREFPPHAARGARRDSPARDSRESARQRQVLGDGQRECDHVRVITRSHGCGPYHEESNLRRRVAWEMCRPGWARARAGSSRMRERE